MLRYGIDAVLLSGPVNIRYATGTRNMQVFGSRNTPSRYLLMTAQHSIPFEFTGCEHMADGFETVDEVRPAMTASFVAAGPAIATREKAWAEEMASTLCELVGSSAVVGVERLNAGERTNPWFQECANRIIEPNELIALDTDVVGCHGYYSDFSRTFHSGPGKPDDHQRTLYQVAHEQVCHNMELIRPGMSFRDYADAAWDIPESYRENRYYLSAHGCGMTGEYPYLYHRADFPDAGYDGMIEVGMTICVESYIGE